MSEILPTKAASSKVAATTDVLTDLQRFEGVVRAQLARVGLPSNEVFVDVSERPTMLSNVSGVLAGLEADVLGRAQQMLYQLRSECVGHRVDGRDLPPRPTSPRSGGGGVDLVVRNPGTVRVTGTGVPEELEGAARTAFTMICEFGLAT